MSKKITTIYSCSKCDAQFNKWEGRCNECGAWGSIKKFQLDQHERVKADTRVDALSTVDLSKISNENIKRQKTGISELDRVLGDGLVPGSLLLMAGEPGIGKSTLLAQLVISLLDKNPLYVSGEESARQVKNRFDRLYQEKKPLKFLGETNVEKIIATIEKEKPGLVVIDSIQTTYSLLSDSDPGSINQIRTATMRFLELAKKNNITIILVGHITKDGNVAGPKSLEHIVDAVFYLENSRNNQFRILRAIKNRYGSVNEIGVFNMTGIGLAEMKNPSQVFIDEEQKDVPGSVVSMIQEGSRPFLVEIQALVSKTAFGYPQRKASGYDLNRLQVLISVISKRAGMNLSNQDVIINTVGGLKVNDPAIDLAICLAIIYSRLNQSSPRNQLVIGEIGLGGEVRQISNLKNRLNEATKLGFKSAIAPLNKTEIKNLKQIKIKELKDALSLIK
ncbi:MAG: DNA repair protein RadA [Patescibacteria group bacterium]|nr:DNA repair protein RadA [Patescibacteria group bacterium]